MLSGEARRAHSGRGRRGGGGRQDVMHAPARARGGHLRAVRLRGLQRGARHRDGDALQAQHFAKLLGRERRLLGRGSGLGNGLAAQVRAGRPQEAARVGKLRGAARACTGPRRPTRSTLRTALAASCACAWRATSVAARRPGCCSSMRAQSTATLPMPSTTTRRTCRGRSGGARGKRAGGRGAPPAERAAVESQRPGGYAECHRRPGGLAMRRGEAAGGFQHHQDVSKRGVSSTTRT